MKHSFITLYYSKVNRQQCCGSLSQVSFGPSSRGEEVVAKGSKHRRQDGGGGGRGEGTTQAGWGGMLPFIIWELKVTWGGCLNPSSRQIHEEYPSLLLKVLAESKTRCLTVSLSYSVLSVRKF